MAATQFYVVMPLYSYQKTQATFPILPNANEPEFHPASAINIEIIIFRLDVEEIFQLWLNKII